jgi:hypothetical protein
LLTIAPTLTIIYIRADLRLKDGLGWIIIFQCTKRALSIYYKRLYNVCIVGVNNLIGIGAKGLKVTFFNLVLKVLKLILSLYLLRFPLYSIASLLSLLLLISS